MRFAVICSLIFLFFSCSENQKNSSSKVNSSHSEEFELVEEEFYPFRRAYHGQDTLEGKEWDTFINRNPEPCEDFAQSKKHQFYSRLIDANIILDRNLNTDKIDTLPQQFDYQFSPEKQFSVETRLIEDPEVVNSPSYEVSFKDKKEVVLVDTLEFGFPPDVTFFTTDLNTDGKQELITLFRWYIVNGDNFDLRIYQLKKKPHQSKD